MPKKEKAKVSKTLDGFINLAARMGSRANNLFSDGTYIFDLLSRNRVKLEAMYRGSWLVGAAVDCVAEDMTRAGINIKGDPDPQQIQKLQSQLTRLGIWDSILNTIKWGRLYGGAIAFIVIDGQDPSTPLNIDTVGLNQFVGLRVYDRWQVQPDVENIIQWGPDAETPAYYRIVSNIMTGNVSDLRIHHSRIIRYVGIQLPAYQAVTEQYWGESVIERINDCIVAFDTATEGVANLVNKAHLRTVQIEGLRDILSAGGNLEKNLLKMFKTMAHLQSNEGMTLLDKQDVFQTHTYNFSGLNDIILQFAQQISGATGIPLVRLFGQSPIGLNSTGESDWRMYFDSIQAQQESRLRSGLMKVISPSI
jgi:phage-related protein (TIGR01555 family)